MSASPVIEGDELRISFAAPWSLKDHSLFIQAKALPEMRVGYDPQADIYTLSAPARFAGALGLQVPPRIGQRLPIAEHLFDYQRWIVEMALAAKRFAVWADCGLGKTPIALEWARQVMALTGGRVLILAPSEVARQFVDESRKFYGAALPVRFLETRAAVEAFCQGRGRGALATTNYEKLIPGELPQMRLLGGLVCDESSMLKSGGGVIKWNLIRSAKGIEYKLSATATPAPNDSMEYASQASFLEKLRTEGEILWTFFHRDPVTQAWRVKPHARDAFYRFMAGWSIYLRKPSAYGFADPFADVPEPEIVSMPLEATSEQAAEAREFMRVYDPEALIPQERLGVTERTKLSQIAKGFLYGDEGTRRIPSPKPKVIARLVREELQEGRQILVWTVFDEESAILAEAIRNKRAVAVLHGKLSADERVRILRRFAAGKIRVLVSKASLLGYGLNFQFCTRMIFSGFDDSFERFYQAVRRCYRYGSREQLRVFVPFLPGLEDTVWNNVLRKRAQWESDTAAQEALYRAALRLPA